MVAGTTTDGMPVLPRQLLMLGLVMQAMCAFDQWTWFWSLHYTLVAANNAIYQSSAAFVFVISVLLLGERVTQAKVSAVVVCILGVILVSFAPTDDDEAVAGHAGTRGWCRPRLWRCQRRRQRRAQRHALAAAAGSCGG